MTSEPSKQDLPKPRETFRPEDRLRRREEILRVQKNGQKAHSQHFLFLAMTQIGAEAGPTRQASPEIGPTRQAMPDVPAQRLGITATKKIANAVGRNRVKRLLREVFRRNRHLLPAKIDLLVIAKAGSPNLQYDQVLREFADAARALHRRFSGSGTATLQKKSVLSPRNEGR